MGRTPLQIVDQVIATLPSDVVDKGFKSIRESIAFAAPELQWLHFERFQNLFHEIMPVPLVEEWHFNAVSALTLISVEDVKKQFSQKTQ